MRKEASFGSSEEVKDKKGRKNESASPEAEKKAVRITPLDIKNIKGSEQFDCATYINEMVKMYNEGDEKFRDYDDLRYALIKAKRLGIDVLDIEEHLPEIQKLSLKNSIKRDAGKITNIESGSFLYSSLVKDISAAKEMGVDVSDTERQLPELEVFAQIYDVTTQLDHRFRAVNLTALKIKSDGECPEIEDLVSSINWLEEHKEKFPHVKAPIETKDLPDFIKKAGRRKVDRDIVAAYEKVISFNSSNSRGYDPNFDALIKFVDRYGIDAPELKVVAESCKKRLEELKRG